MNWTSFSLGFGSGVGFVLVSITLLIVLAVTFL